MEPRGSPDTGSAYSGPDSSSPEPEGDLSWQVHARSASYSDPAAVVSYARLAPRSTAIRTDATLAARFDPELGGRRLANYLRTLTLETQTLARACGKSHVHNLEPEDLVALTVEAAAMARVPLAGTGWVPGSGA